MIKTLSYSENRKFKVTSAKAEFCHVTDQMIYLLMETKSVFLTFLTKVLSELLQFVQVLLIDGRFGVCQ